MGGKYKFASSEKSVQGYGVGSSGSRQDPAMDSCEDDNELAGSIRDGAYIY
jgi:hypothetical protein